jgi:hypothetical protein
MLSKISVQSIILNLCSLRNNFKISTNEIVVSSLLDFTKSNALYIFVCVAIDTQFKNLITVGKMPRTHVNEEHVNIYLTQEKSKRKILLQKFIDLCVDSKVNVCVFYDYRILMNWLKTCFNNSNNHTG